MGKKRIAYISLILSLLSSNLLAMKFNIIHTNDMHSFMNYSDHDPQRGGFATVKNIITAEKEKAKSEGIPALAMDAGDFSEGNSFYLAQRGRMSFEAMNLLGHDVVTIGNHDYLMGTEELDQILGETTPHFAFLGANFLADAHYTNINKFLRPYKIFNLNGLSVGVIGLTTNDILYKWRLNNAKIVSEVNTAKETIKVMKAEGAQVIIALTHLGVFKDRVLAQLVPEIDLIVGGHSHDALFTPLWSQHLNKKIPIVQAGQHGSYVGRLKLDFDPVSKKLSVLDYQLLPTYKKVYGENHEVLDYIDLSNEFLHQAYGKEWLEEENVATSQLLPESEGGSATLWGHFITDALRVSGKAHLGIHTQALSGSNYPIKGNINRRQLFDSNPRIFEFDDKYGYHVYTTDIPGFLLKFVFKAVINFKIPLYFSGVSFNYTKDKLGICRSIKNITFDGEKVKPFKLYKVAMSESIIRGGLEISSAVKLIFKNSKKLDISMWQSLEDWARHVGTVTPRYLEESPTFFYKTTKGQQFNQSTTTPHSISRMVIDVGGVEIQPQ